MTEHPENRPPHTPPSGPDGEGVRVIRKPRQGGHPSRWGAALVVVAIAATLGWWVRRPVAEPGAASLDHQAATVEAATVAAVDANDSRRVPGRPEPAERERPGSNSDDLAAYFKPGDPEPTAAEVIEALQHAGVRTGLGAFNPPGTSPPLEGLAVPDGFQLPEGYARHHQVTDAGVPIEPILMFAPGFTLYDAQGRPIPMPANGVVPPDLAPPGMPRRMARVPRQ